MINPVSACFAHAVFIAIISHFLGRLIKYCFENIPNRRREILLFSTVRRHLLCLSWVALFFTDLLYRGVKKRAVLGKAEGCSGRGSPGSWCSAASSLVPEPWGARLGSGDGARRTCDGGDGLGLAPAAVGCLSAIPSLVAGTARLTPHVSPTSWSNPGLIHGQQNSILRARLETSSRGDVAAAALPGVAAGWRRRCSASAA